MPRSYSTGSYRHLSPATQEETEEASKYYYAINSRQKYQQPENLFSKNKIALGVYSDNEKPKHEEPQAKSIINNGQSLATKRLQNPGSLRSAAARIIKTLKQKTII